MGWCDHSPLTLVGDGGGEQEFKGKTGSLATAQVPLKVEGLSDVSSGLHRDNGADERWSARVLCRPIINKTFAYLIVNSTVTQSLTCTVYHIFYLLVTAG